jgi:hypothetical protein
MEAGAPPPAGCIENMGKLIGRTIKEGKFLDGAGLHPSATRVRLTFDGDRREVVRGPYRGSNELVAAFAMIVAKSVDHAIELATRLAVAAGDRELEIGPVVEGWELHGGKRPASAPYRFLLLRKADAAFEAGGGQPPAAQAVLDEWKRDGILQSASVLAPSATAVRARGASKSRRWVDGPFTESKELIAGFSIIEMASLAEAKTWAEEYEGILGGDTEVDIRGVV